MELKGRRIHITGSANAETGPDLVRYAHELVDRLVRTLAARGATFVVGVGKEPPLRPDDPSSPSLVFDWTALAAADAALRDGRAVGAGQQGRLVATVGTAKTDKQIPAARRALWDGLLAVDAVQVEFIEAGWASGHARRRRQAQLGDVLIALGGGEGVEHLAQLYAEARKPVVPLDLELGASTDDGSGGAARLYREALGRPADFVRLRDPGAAGRLLAGIAARDGQRPAHEVVASIVGLIEALVPPTVFYVRLLDRAAEEFEAVEAYFRRVVDPVVADFGYVPIEMGRGKNEYAWMNEAIFDDLHHSDVVVADLTGVRPNCFLELGYALGHGQQVIVTAKKGTARPFDTSMIERLDWEEEASDHERIAELREHWARNADRGPIVRPRRMA